MESLQTSGSFSPGLKPANQQKHLRSLDQPASKKSYELLAGRTQLRVKKSLSSPRCSQTKLYGDLSQFQAAAAAANSPGVGWGPGLPALNPCTPSQSYGTCATFGFKMEHEMHQMQHRQESLGGRWSSYLLRSFKSTLLSSRDFLLVQLSTFHASMQHEHALHSAS